MKSIENGENMKLQKYSQKRVFKQKLFFKHPSN